MKDVVHQSHGHLVANFLTRCQKSHTQNGSLAELVLTQTFVHQSLDLQHVAATHIGSTDDKNFDEFFNWVRDDLESLNSCLAFVLLSHIEKSKTDSKILGKVLVQLVGIFS